MIDSYRSDADGIFQVAKWKCKSVDDHLKMNLSMKKGGCDDALQRNAASMSASLLATSSRFLKTLTLFQLKLYHGMH